MYYGENGFLVYLVTSHSDRLQPVSADYLAIRNSTLEASKDSAFNRECAAKLNQRINEIKMRAGNRWNNWDFDDVDDPSSTRAAKSTIVNHGFRTWSDRSGSFNLRAKLVKKSDSEIVLEREDGKSIAVSISKLSQADRDHLKLIANF
jgi:hypothetical protein